MYKSLSKNYKNYKILPKELLFSINFISIKFNNTAEDLSKLIGCSGDTALRILENGLSNEDDLILIANYALKEKKNIYLAVDGLIIKKYFSEKIVYFLTYSLIQILRKKKRLKNSESLINRLKFKNLQYIFSELYSIYQLVHQS